MRLFSVIIPTFNRADFLGRALQSVCAQEFQDFEVIVVDDGSTEDLSSVVRPHQGRIRMVRHENSGPGAARNRGIREAQCEYVAFLDSDDLWFPWTLSTYAHWIDERRRPAVIAGALIYFHHEVELRCVAHFSSQAENYEDYFTAGANGIYCGSGQMCARRDLLLQAGGFIEDRMNGEDHDLVMRLGIAPGFVQITSPPMIGYRQHAAAETRDIHKSVAGCLRLIDFERAGRYPGDSSRRRDRWRILTRHVRPLTLELIRQGEMRAAWRLYRRTFAWNLAIGRARYLFGFMAMAASMPLRRRRPSAPIAPAPTLREAESVL